eukprot:7375728-Alexandrium_andersonii.AAC.1
MRLRWGITRGGGSGGGQVARCQSCDSLTASASTPAWSALPDSCVERPALVPSISSEAVRPPNRMRK